MSEITNSIIEYLLLDISCAILLSILLRWKTPNNLIHVYDIAIHNIPPWTWVKLLVVVCSMKKTAPIKKPNCTNKPTCK